MRRPYVIVCGLLIVCTSQAAVQSLPFYEMEPVTVTANRTTAAGDETGTVEVITNDMTGGLL